MSSGSLARALLAIAFVMGAVSATRADDVADFYAGKRVTLLIGYGTGGGYDAYARALARFLGDHIPGKPTIVAMNMPGAGSRGAANYLYNVAPKDGSVIATISQTTPTDQLMGQPGIQFEAQKFNWIGNMVAINNIAMVATSAGVKTIDDAKKKEVVVGASGAAAPSGIYPQASNNLLGTRFKIIAGYRGSGDINLAMERGEVQGRTGSWAAIKATHGAWLRDGTAIVLYQVGPKREADLPDVPLWTELTTDDEQRQVLDILSSDVAVGRPIVTAPDVPADRVRALRRAFDDTLKDERFIAAAKVAKMDLHPIGGAELQEIIGRIVARPPTIVAAVKKAIQPRDVAQRK
jgi:tripartite-type tricarboxylate transporter receptor subunit TctC